MKKENKKTKTQLEDIKLSAILKNEKIKPKFKKLVKKLLKNQSFEKIQKDRPDLFNFKKLNKTSKTKSFDFVLNFFKKVLTNRKNKIKVSKKIQIDKINKFLFLKKFNSFSFSKKTKKMTKKEFVEKYFEVPKVVPDNILLMNDFEIGENLPHEILSDFINKENSKKFFIFFVISFICGLLFFSSIIFFLGLNTNWFKNFYFRNPFYKKVNNINKFNFNLKANNIFNATLMASEFVFQNKNNFFLGFSKNYVFDTPNDGIQIFNVLINDDNSQFSNNFFKINLIGEYYNNYGQKKLSTSTFLLIAKDSSYFDISGSSFLKTEINILNLDDFWLLRGNTFDFNIFKKFVFYQDELNKIIFNNLKYSFLGAKIVTDDYDEITGVRGNILPIDNNGNFTGFFSLYEASSQKVVLVLKISFKQNVGFTLFQKQENSFINKNSALTKFGSRNNFASYKSKNDKNGKPIFLMSGFYYNLLFFKFYDNVGKKSRVLVDTLNLKYLIFKNLALNFNKISNITLTNVQINSFSTENITHKSTSFLNVDKKYSYNFRNIFQNIVVVSFNKNKVKYGFLVLNYNNYLKNISNGDEQRPTNYFLFFPFILVNNVYELAEKNISSVGINFDKQKGIGIPFISFAW